MSRPSRLRWVAPLVLGAAAGAQDASVPLLDEPVVDVEHELALLRARIAALEAAPPASDDARGPVDLAGDELASIPRANGNHVLSRPWFDNLSISGFAAVTWLDSGGTGSVSGGAFFVKEATLFVDADVWKNTSVFIELWAGRYFYGDRFRANELYVEVRELGGSNAGARVGRFEIPFGEEYLRWDAPEHPLINFTAADPYGVDAGVELYGSVGGLGWVVAVANGDEDDSTSGPLVALKAYGDLHRDVFLSGSLLSTGSVEASTLRLSGTEIGPVGADGPSTGGTSPSEDVEALCWEADARLFGQRRAALLTQLGGARIDDDVDAFDRDLLWYAVEPSVRVTRHLDVVLRYSGIQTDDSDEGYRFDGKLNAEGGDLGYDAHRLQRVALGARWTFNPHVALKVEAGQDWFDLIDGSPFDDENDERLYFGFELVASF